MDDMIEFLGPDVLGEHYSEIANKVINFCNSNDSGIRQAATYGIGMIA